MQNEKRWLCESYYKKISLGICHHETQSLQSMDSQDYRWMNDKQSFPSPYGRKLNFWPLAHEALSAIWMIFIKAKRAALLLQIKTKRLMRRAPVLCFVELYAIWRPVNFVESRNITAWVVARFRSSRIELCSVDYIPHYFILTDCRVRQNVCCINDHIYTFKRVCDASLFFFN